MFHRLATPSYFLVPTGTFDYLNTPSLSGGSGVPAFADGQKAGGVNDGTYLTAFGEDATSAFANRGLKALGENTDVLDDLMRRDLALSARTADVTAPAGGVGTIVLSGQVFVGVFGTANTQANRDLLVSILDEDDNEILGETGIKVQASLISNGSTNVVGTVASGFYNTPTVVLTDDIPAGVVYRVYYGERGNLATLPQDAFTSIRIRGAQEVSAEVERLLLDLHTSNPGGVWNGPWLGTISGLVRSGLDGRYRLSTADPLYGPPVNTAGSGAAIHLDGPGLGLYPVAVDLTATRYLDPYMASITQWPTGAPWSTGTYDTAYGGHVGMVQESVFRSTTNVDEVTYSHVSGPLIQEASWRCAATPTLGGDTVASLVNLSVGRLNPTAGTSATDLRTIEVGSYGGGDYLYTGSDCFIRQTDLLEVIINSVPIGVYRPDTWLSTTRATLKAVTNAIPPIGTSGAATDAQYRWLQTTISIGGRHKDATGSAQGIPMFFVAQPSPITTNWDANAFETPALFCSAYGSEHRAAGATVDEGFRAMAWGSFTRAGFYQELGYLLGDGGIRCEGGSQTVNLLTHNAETYSVVNGVTKNIHWENNYDGSLVEVVGPVGGYTTTTTVNFYVDTTYGAVKSGSILHVLVHVPVGSTAGPSVVWPASFQFSGADGVIPLGNPTSGELTYSFTFKYSGHLAKWLAHRTDY